MSKAQRARKASLLCTPSNRPPCCVARGMKPLLSTTTVLYRYSTVQYQMVLWQGYAILRTVLYKKGNFRMGSRSGSNLQTFTSESRGGWRGIIPCSSVQLVQCSVQRPGGAEVEPVQCSVGSLCGCVRGVSSSPHGDAVEVNCRNLHALQPARVCPAISLP